ncbi:MAG: ribosome-associated translation inhibitor RaiA [Acidimicrobiia bacterium]|nr:ribosome-associated translation inhibitor RaiA [Acidimicrobiia bacterium]
MEVRVHSTRMNVSDDLRTLAEEKVEHASRVFDGATFADVEFTEEQNPRLSDERYRVEITASAASHTVRVESAAFDDRAALDTAVDKLERQLRKLKGRLIARNRQPVEKHLNTPLETSEEEDELRIERVKQFIVKPMSPEEAALQMDLLGHNFYFFLNAETDRYGVIYRRRGGTLGLIEPQ